VCTYIINLDYKSDNYIFLFPFSIDKKPKLEINNNTSGSNITFESLAAAQNIRLQIEDDFHQKIEKINMTVDAIDTTDSKVVNIQRIIEKMKFIDQNRVRIDEERLKLEIHRNELDKIGYELSDLLAKILAN
jgi:hypothetical protein